jgi:hypothetical protein
MEAGKLLLLHFTIALAYSGIISSRSPRSLTCAVDGVPMRRTIACLIALYLMFQSGCLAEKEKLYGIWKLESGPSDFPEGTVIEFTKGGKFRMGVMKELYEDETKMSERGMFEVNGNSITFSYTGQKGATWRIVELADDQLTIKENDAAQDAIFKKRRS